MAGLNSRFKCHILNTEFLLSMSEIYQTDLKFYRLFFFVILMSV